MSTIEVLRASTTRKQGQYGFIVALAAALLLLAAANVAFVPAADATNSDAGWIVGP
jgi:hypothetical protein